MVELGEICRSMYRARDQGNMIKRCEENPANQFLDSNVLRNIKNKCMDKPFVKSRKCASEQGLNVPEPMEADGQSTEDKRREEERMLTSWGKLTFKFGVDVKRYHTLFKDAFKEWNAGQHAEATTSDDGVIDKGVRLGRRIAVTTEPGLTRLSEAGALFRVTWFDITSYDDEELRFDVDPNKSRDDIYRLSVGDNSQITVLDGELQIPLSGRNFFEMGTSMYKDDLLWWKAFHPFVFIPLNLHLGLNRQFQGTPITGSDHIPEATNMNYMLSSYTVFGVSAEIAGVDLLPIQKAAEFCGQATDNCEDENGEIPSNSDSFPYGQGKTSQRFWPGVGFIPSYALQTRVTTHLFGEQRYGRVALAYRTYADFYPLWKIVEIGGASSFHLSLGRAIEFYIEGEGRQLQSYEQTGHDVLLPYSGFDLGVYAGIGFHPYPIEAYFMKRKEK